MDCIDTPSIELWRDRVVWRFYLQAIALCWVSKRNGLAVATSTSVYYFRCHYEFSNEIPTRKKIKWASLEFFKQNGFAFFLIWMLSSLSPTIALLMKFYFHALHRGTHAYHRFIIEISFGILLLLWVECGTFRKKRTLALLSRLITSWKTLHGLEEPSTGDWHWLWLIPCTLDEMKNIFKEKFSFLQEPILISRHGNEFGHG